MRNRPGSFTLGPPHDLAAWELVIDDLVFTVFEWSSHDPMPAADLTGAERDVLRMIVAGQSNAAIARQRRRSVRTVANQIASIFRKLGVGSRAELIARMVGQRGG